MKNNTQLILILTLLLIVLFGSVFKDKAIDHNMFVEYQNRGNDIGSSFAKKTIKKSEYNNQKDSFIVKNKKLKDERNITKKTLNSLPQLKNKKHTIAQSPFTSDYNQDVPVITLENQVDVADSTKRQFKKWSENMELQGYIETDDYSVLKLPSEAVSIQQTRSEPLDEIYDNLVFEPTPLNDTVFDQGKYLGHRAEIGLLEDEGIEIGPSAPSDNVIKPVKMGGFARYYKFPELGFVKFTERFLPDDSQSRITPELMNADVNGIVAYYLVQKGSTKQSLSLLTWIIGRREYILEASNTGNIEDNNYKQSFFDLANSIP